MRRRAVVLILLFVVPITAHLSGQSTAANTTGLMRWLIDLNFAGDQINAVLTLTIEFDDPTQDTIVEVTNLECVAQGSLELSNEQAIFSGDDYIVCDMPDLVNKVSELTKGALLIASDCTCEEEDPWIAGQLMLDSDNQQAEALNPIFHHPDIQLYAPISSKQAALVFNVDNKSAQSANFDFSSDMDLPIWAEYTEVAANNYEPEFIVDGTDLTATPTAVSGPLNFSNEATSIYIGYTSGSYLEGVLTWLQVDPACRGYG